MKNFSRSELLLLVSSVLLTLMVAVGLLRWFAPGLLGIPVDLQTVRVAEKKPPFYDNVFNRDDYRSRELLLKDPYTNVRAKPLIPEALALGPHDLLGFRNRAIPNVADVVVIGDSQTYGNNVVLKDNWPSRLASRLGNGVAIYSMATGGWGAVQYLDMFGHATVFRPRVFVIAFYAGNDSFESTALAYSVKRWGSLRPDPDLDLKDHPPSVSFPPPESLQWPVSFKDGVKTVFTPELRLTANDTSYATVRAGYSIMAEVARQIAQLANQTKARIIFTVIPTKELVYEKKMKRDRIAYSDSYEKLLNFEKTNIEKLAKSMKLLPGVTYVDLVEPLQQAALKPVQLYPENMNGHPLEGGYKVIANAIAPAVRGQMKSLRYARRLGAINYDSNQARLVLVERKGYWFFSSPQIASANGWRVFRKQRLAAPMLELREVIGLPLLGVIDRVDRRRFGPTSGGR